MKKISSRNPVDTEAFVLGMFEKFFIFEFYVRYLRSRRSQDLQKILQLKESIRHRFIDLNVMSELAEGRFAFDDDPEMTYGSDIELHELVNWTLNSIQFSDCRLEDLCSELSRMKLPKNLVDRLFTPFNELNDTIEPRLKMLCYRFSDLTSPHEIHFVFQWWHQHLDQDIRAKQKLLGKFGTASIGKNEFDEDNTGDTVYGYSDVPFTVPRVIFFKNSNYDIYNADHHEVSVDGKPLSKSIVLTVNFDNAAQNLDEILDEFKSQFFGTQALWYLDQLESGSYPGFDIRSSKSTTDSAIKVSKQNYRLLTRYDSIAKNLAGLMCYDAFAQEREQKVSLPRVAEDISKEISYAYDADTIVQYYHDVRKMINNMDEIIRKKYPDIVLGHDVRTTA